MTTLRSHRITTAVLLAGAAALLLSSCSLLGESSDTSNGPRLVDTKAPAQLLRNEAAGKIPLDSQLGTVKAEDSSTTCSSEDVDPEGKERSWRSTALVELKSGIEPKDIVAGVVAGFEENGWEEGTFGNATIVELTKEGLETSIRLATFSAKDEKNARVQITVAGPCVMTDGTDSKEVKLAEGTWDEDGDAASK
jgi:hypothetical protein